MDEGAKVYKWLYSLHSTHLLALANICETVFTKYMVTEKCVEKNTKTVQNQKAQLPMYKSI